MSRSVIAALLAVAALVLLLVSKPLAATVAIAAFLLIGNQHSFREEDHEPKDLPRA